MRATTRGALFRGTMPDPEGYEEPVDDNTAPLVGLDDFPVSIIETAGHEFDESTNAWRYVRKYTGRVSSRVGVLAGDRIRDNRTGSFYKVGEVESMARGLSGRSSVTMTMTRTAP